MSVYPDGSRPVPDDVKTVSTSVALQDLTEDKIRGQIRAKHLPPWSQVGTGMRTVLAGVVNFFGSAMLGSWNRVDPEDVDLSSGQLEISGRTDLLDGVRGYCATFQSRNIDSGRQEGVFSHGLPGYRLLPFNKQLGPAKGAHPHPDGGIVFDEPGLWTVYVYAFLGDAPNVLDALAEDPNWVRMTVWNKDPKIQDAAKFDSLEWTHAGKVGVLNVATFSVPVVIPSAGYTVTVEGKATRNRWWRGGTKYSRMAVVKHDNRVEHLPQETVPNE